jgi:hypothetical protein
MSSHTAVSEAQLTDYLTWSGVHRDEYDVRFGRRAEARLTNAIASIRRLGRDDGLLDAIIGDLHADSLLWIMQAPELEYLLRGARLPSVPATLSTFLFDSLRFELLLHSPSPAGADAAALWSARGELCLGAALRAEDPGAERPGSSRLALARAAACIGPGIPIDFDSPYNRRDLPNRFPVYASHASDERGIVLDKLRDAFALIETTGEAVTRFAVSFTQVIVPIRVDASGPWFGSFSSSWYPGRTVLPRGLRDLPGGIPGARNQLRRRLRGIPDRSDRGPCAHLRTAVAGGSGAADVRRSHHVQFAAQQRCAGWRPGSRARDRRLVAPPESPCHHGHCSAPCRMRTT